MANRLEALHFLLRDAEGVATLAAVINGRADLQQTLIMMCPAFAPRPPVPMNHFANSTMSFPQIPLPLNSPSAYMTPFSPNTLQNAPLTPVSVPNFAVPMPVCPKCHHAYGPERMAVHVKVCGGSLDRGGENLRSPGGFGRSSSSSNLEQTSQESNLALDEYPRLLNEQTVMSGGRSPASDSRRLGAFGDQPPSGGSRRNSLSGSCGSCGVSNSAPTSAPTSGCNSGGSYARDEKPVGSRGGAYMAKDDQPIGGSRNGPNAYLAKDEQAIGARRSVREEVDEPQRGGSAFVAKEDRPVGGAGRGGGYAAKEDQSIGRRSTDTSSLGEEQNRGGGGYLSKDEKAVGGGNRGYAAKDDQPIGGRPGTGAYAAKDEQPIGARRGKDEFTEENRGGGAYLAKDEKPVGGGKGSGAYAAKDEQPIGGRSGTGAYAAKDEQPIGGRRRSVKEDQSPFVEPEVRASSRRRSVKEESLPELDARGGGAYLAKDEKPVGGSGKGAYTAKDEQIIGGSGRGAFAAKEEQTLVRDVESNSRRGSRSEEMVIAHEDEVEEEDGYDDERRDEEENLSLRAGTGSFLAKDEKPVGRVQMEGQESPEQEEARVACPKCNRQFASSRIEKHSKVCKADSSSPAVAEEKPETPKPIPKPPVKKPEAVDGVKKKSFAERQMEALEAKFQACPKCGRKFAPDRIVKHESVCKGIGVKKADEEDDLPTKEETEVEKSPPSRDRGVSPKKIAPAPPPEGGKRKTFAERQMEAMEAKFQTCAKCGRKFAPDRIDKHESVCKGEKPLTRASAAEDPDDALSKQANKSEASCGFCKRKFAKDALEAHESVCQVLLLEDEIALTATQASKKVVLPAGFKPMQR